MSDRLLPKLVSGEIWVEDAEKMVEELDSVLLLYSNPYNYPANESCLL